MKVEEVVWIIWAILIALTIISMPFDLLSDPTPDSMMNLIFLMLFAFAIKYYYDLPKNH